MVLSLVYRFFYWLILSRLPAEATHQGAFFMLRLLMAMPGVRALARSLLAPRDVQLQVEALGMRFPSPLGLAAGFDKNAVGYEALGALGFGFVEIGTVTGHAQQGNAKPRMFRLRRDRALINRMGFNNGGSALAAERLMSRPTDGSLIVGANIGKTKAVPVEGAVADYVLSAERLGPVCDYMVVNVSSPNTPGLRDLQSVEQLRPLLTAVRATLNRVREDKHLPLLVKIAPDLADEDVDAVADLALELKLDGIIATNTTISRANLQTDEHKVAEIGAGGLSGAPLKERSLEVLRRLKARVDDNLVLIAAGGIETGDDAFARLEAGATLLQAYTGFIYGGPLWPRKLSRYLAHRLRHKPGSDKC
ncbi:MAG: quinone-dependent dihydroorotate dehydrogenase [Myxococcales bacterium]|nr:quinone-dependent dihydroorotate dehydrogenase [Myxococcales bacterium]